MCLSTRNHNGKSGTDLNIRFTTRKENCDYEQLYQYQQNKQLYLGSHYWARERPAHMWMGKSRSLHTNVEW